MSALIPLLVTLPLLGAAVALFFGRARRVQVGVSLVTLTLVLVIAAVQLAALGLEREIDNQPAGFRTHILVCLGAALFGLISVHAFAPFEATRNSTDVQIDVTRVASQVVVGVGFLGGGAILTETVYNLDGVGLYAGEAIRTLDLPPLMAVTMFGAFFIVLFNTIVDIAYAVLDPRIRLGQAAPA